jgi:hypothetical protein
VTVVAKVCTLCGEGKTLRHFPRKSTGKYGYDARCSDCKNAQRRARKTARIDQANLRVHRSVHARVVSLSQETGIPVHRLTGYLLAYALEAHRAKKLAFPT